MTEARTNWAGNYTFKAERVYSPTTIEEIQAIANRSRKLKVLGSGHSFNDIADTPQDQISLKNFNRVVGFDREQHTVTVEAGITYGQLSEQLEQQGYALPNMASLPHISVAGACSTATHGSGVANGNLSTVVSALQLITAEGEVVELSRKQQGDQFDGAVVSLGGLGIITRLTLDLVPTFDIAQEVYQDLPFSELEVHFEEIAGSAYSVSLFTNWQTDRINQVWLKRRVGDETTTSGAEWFGARRALVKLHPIGAHSAETCTDQLGIAGRWHERLPHFRMGFTPSSGEELQTEYLLPRQWAFPALQAINRLRDRIAPLLLISELRTVAADQLWMSPAYRQDCLAIHFTWQKNWPAVQQLLPLIEAELAPYRPIPHWGKLFTLSASQLQTFYPRLSDFQKLLQTYDPKGKFRNRFLDSYIF